MQQQITVRRKKRAVKSVYAERRFGTRHKTESGYEYVVEKVATGSLSYDIDADEFLIDWDLVSDEFEVRRIYVDGRLICFRDVFHDQSTKVEFYDLCVELSDVALLLLKRLLLRKKVVIISLKEDERSVYRHYMNVCLVDRSSVIVVR